MNHTSSILSALETMRRGELAKGEKTSAFKARAYKKVMDQISGLGRPIQSYDDLAGVTGIGEKIEEKIKEILATGSLASAERVKAEYSIDAVDELLTVHGIGPVKARELVAAGIKSVAALAAAVKAEPTLLNATQKMGLKYHNTATLRIPREEMTVHEDVLQAFMPKGLKGVVVGSYRRGAADSGDVDMLLTPKSGSLEDAQELFETFVAGLKESDYIIDELVSGEKKWMGYVRVGSAAAPGKARRLDLLLTAPAEYAYALLYFTGSDKFNVAFRKYAGDKGYTLNEHIMVPLKGSSVAVPPGMKGEKDIFAFLGLRYVPPEERIDGRQVVPV
jgi:DNA polymerase/3'-5' exonuclease PolX